MVVVLIALVISLAFAVLCVVAVVVVFGLMLLAVCNLCSSVSYDGGLPHSKLHLYVYLCNVLPAVVLMSVLRLSHAIFPTKSSSISQLKTNGFKAKPEWS